jgi:hypothetical protein
MYIEYHGNSGETDIFAFNLGPDRLEALVSDTGVCLRIDGEVLETPLAEIVLEELARNVKKEPPEVVKKANRILTKLGKNPISIKNNSVPLEDEKGYTKVRHYTTSSRAEKIASSLQFGGNETPKQLDQGKIFVELASSQPLSQQDFVKRYALSPNAKKGSAYVEFMVPDKDLSSQKCRRTGKPENFLRLNGQGSNPTYHIKSKIKVVRNS